MYNILLHLDSQERPPFLGCALLYCYNVRPCSGVGLVLQGLEVVTRPAQPLQVTSEVIARVTVTPIESAVPRLLHSHTRRDYVVNNLADT